ncbi:MAG: branched-chain amino acid ABC transporter permease [Acholeplasmataceae bacterium]|nr:branched-chain amino acid ABC transporter permease [Acholeplasmataceae bacterium]
MDLIGIINRLILALADAAPLALVTLAIVLIFRTSFTTNFAQGMIATSAAYVVTVLYNRHLIIHYPDFSVFLLMMVAFISGIIVGFLIGVFIDVVLIRKSRYSNILTKQMITMGSVLFLMGLLPTIFFKADLNMPSIPRFFTENIKIPIGDQFIVMQENNLFSILVATVVISIVFIALKYTKWGLGVRSTASNEKVASMMGVNTKMITALSWGIAGALGSLGAILYATTQTVSVAMMTEMQVNGFLASILGGFSTFFGPIIGAIIIPILSLISYIVSPLIKIGDSDLGIYYKVFVYLIILIIILIKPIGLFGKKIAKKV